MMTSVLHDIYDPPPAPVPLAPPPAEPMARSSGDLAIFVGLGAIVLAGSAWAWTVDPGMAALTLVGGTIVVVESWSTALGFLHRRPWMGLNGRWKIFAAALVPWVVGLGLAAGLMIAMFYLADHAG